jgi:translation initiation factor 2 subunit 1
VFLATAEWDCVSCFLQELYKQLAWPLYKGYGHAFEAFKNMVQDDGAAIFKKLEEDRGPLTVLTPQV